MESELNDDDLRGELNGAEWDPEVAQALNRQDEALALLARLHLCEPAAINHLSQAGGGRRDGRRWPKPDTVSLELHDGVRWQLSDCKDVGVGGARVGNLPEWADGPTPVRLKAEGLGVVLALADVMWHDSHGQISGIRFEFTDNEEHDLWAGLLLDALLARFVV